MIERQRRLDRMRNVELEFQAALSAAELLEGQLRGDPNWGNVRGWRHRDALRWAENLEATYLIRLYAEFESGLRGYWERSMNRSTTPPMKDLLVAVAGQRIPQPEVEAVIAVQRYRNGLVHEGRAVGESVMALAEAKHRLCLYFSRLPRDW